MEEEAVDEDEGLGREGREVKSLVSQSRDRMSMLLAGRAPVTLSLV